MNIATAPQTLALAAVGPEFTIRSPVAGSSVNATTLTVWGTIMSTSQIGPLVELTVDSTPLPRGISVPPGADTWSTTVQISSANGPHRIDAKATFPRDGDQPGSTASTSVVFMLDTVAPVVTITAPAANAQIPVGAQGASVGVAATVTDPAGVASVQASVGGINWVGLSRDPANGANWAGTVSLPAALGQQTISVRATDAAGNVTPAPVSVTITAIDNTAPVVAITAPAANAQFPVGELGGSVPVSVTATDYFGVASVKCRVGTTGDWTPLSSGAAGSGQWTGSILLPGVPVGTQTIAVQAADASGNVTTASVPVKTTDNTPPAYEISAPPDGARILRGAGANITFVGSASDRQSLVKSVAWSVDGGTPVKIENNPPVATMTWSAPIDASQLEPGLHPVQFTFTDVAGNVAVALRHFEVTSTQYTTVAERLSPRAYLDALVQFIKKRVNLATRDPLVQLFYQPFAKLIDSPAMFGQQPVNQLRIAVEVLRKVLAAQPQVVLGHWKLDESSGTVASDSSSYGNNATLVNNPAWIDGRWGKALSFNGSNYVQVANAPALEVGKNGADFSVAFWLYLAKPFTGKWRRIMHKGNGDSERTFALLMRPDNNSLDFRISTTANYNEGSTTSSPIEVNTWTHVAYVKTGGRLQLYLNGVPKGGAVLNGTSVSNSGPLQLGNVAFQQDTNLFAGLDGALDDVRLYNFALPPKAVVALAGPDPASAVLAPALVGNWKFDEGSGSAAQDSSNYGNNAVLLNAPGWIAGRVGKAVSFSPVNSYAQVASTPELELGKNNADFTVAFWLSLTKTSTGAVRSIVHKGASDAQRGFALWMRPGDNGLRYRISTSGGDEGRDSVATIALNTWTHVAYVKAGNQLQLYLNGELDSAVTLAGATIGNSGPLYIGKTPWSAGFEGGLDDLRLYGFALPSDAIALLAGTMTTPTESDYRLLAYETMLAQLGTSYDEIRFIRAADTTTPAGREARQALADRLGIALSPTAPDELDQMFAAPSAVTKSWLAEKFGLLDTTQDVSDSTPTPTLLRWRQTRLQQRWKDDDYPSSPGADLPPIIDPDLIDARDFAHPVGGDSAYGLWTARQAAVSDKYNELKGRLGGKTPPDGFKDIVNAVLTLPVAGNSGMTFLQTVEADYKARKDVAPALRARHLGVPGFLALLRVRDLAAGSVKTPPVNLVTDLDWADACNVLVQAWKEQNYATWRGDESARAITLSPVIFRISRDEKQLTAWRASQAARRAWQDRLQARIDQDQAVRDAFAAAIGATEEATLPMLRDILIARARELSMMTSGRPSTLEDVADGLAARLQIDLRGSGVLKTTRIEQAIETLQGLVFSLRGGLLDPAHPAAGWNLLAGEPGADATEKERNFAEEWRWYRGFDNWRAAMTIYLYPETLLLPSLRTDKTTEYGEIVEQSAFGRPTPVTAREIAQYYWANDTVQSDLSALVTAGKITDAERQALVLTDSRSDADLRKRHAVARKLLLNAQGGALADTPARLREIFYFVPMQLALQLQNAGEFAAALDWFRLVYAYGLPASDRKVYALLEAENGTSNVLADLPLDLNPHHIVASSRAYPYTRYTLHCVSRCFLDFADSEFARGTDESIARARTLYATARNLLQRPELPPPGASEADGKILPNPVLDALRLRVEIRLTKLRQGRNIAGVRREAPVAPAAVSPTVPAPTVLKPTPYRFKVLLERSKQLAAIAQQIEAAYLSALEKRDSETYNLMKANDDLDLAAAGSELQNRRVTEAQDGQSLVAQQQARNNTVKDEYNGMIQGGLNEYEQAMIDNYTRAGEARFYAAMSGAVGQILSLAGSDPIHMLFAPFAAAAIFDSAMWSTRAGAAETNAQIATVNASFERQKQQWEMQVALAKKDDDILQVQALLADDRLGIVQQEQAIAELQSKHAKAVADFLARKFTNAELYDWMSGVLGNVYNYFLQQATAMAQLAQSQLAFERAEQPTAFIRADYWQPPSQAAASSANTPDRRGLTGSARLLEDVTRLDQFAFESDKRKLNLSQTFSLAQLVPYQFQKFRDTGVLSFTTGMELFDRAFPGHYLRLIKRVRMSVIALVPPVQGIRATIAASGSSAVVVSGDAFTTIPIIRDPELVALTSPSNATGLFELDMQSEMLQPFEDRGVDTKWEFRLPKAANPFNFDTIADVLITIDYTALDSADYRDAVIKRLDPAISAERAFSLRDFVDDWYAFNNPTDPAAPLAMTFKIRREHFPPNLKDDNVQIGQLLACLVPKDGVTLPPVIRVADLRRGAGEQPVHPGQSGADGVISSRRSGGLGWQSITGSPIGDWTLTIDPSSRQLFADGKVDDILFVVTYRAELPAWV